MATRIIYTPCDGYYEKCSNYIINDWNNPKCLNCIRNHKFKTCYNVVNDKVVKDYFFRKCG